MIKRLDSILNQIAEYCCKNGVSPIFLRREKTLPIPSLMDEALKIIKDENLNYENGKNSYSQEEYYFLRSLENKIKTKHQDVVLNHDLYLSEIRKNYPELEDMVIQIGDDKGMIEINPSFERCRQFFSINDKALYISETKSGAFNSSLQLSDVLISLASQYPLKIRIDPFRCLSKNNAKTLSERANFYGEKFNFEKLFNLKEEIASEYRPNDHNSLLDGHYTQFLWTPKKDGEVHLSIEELPSRYETNDEVNELNFVRFFHAIFNPQLAKFTHLDGAIHIYDEETYKLRITKHLKERNKSYQKVKIFRIDENLDLEILQALVGPFFKWNWMVLEYFKGE